MAIGDSLLTTCEAGMFEILVECDARSPMTFIVAVAPACPTYSTET